MAPLADVRAAAEHCGRVPLLPRVRAGALAARAAAVALFLAAWTVAGFALYAWLLRPLGRALAAPLLLFCLPQAMVGNIWPLLAVVLVFGFRRPGLWAFPLLTKVTAGVGVVWFAARGEWRNLARVVVPTVLVTAVSVAISPQLWVDWLHILRGGGTGGSAAGGFDIPLVYRLPVALALAVYAARRVSGRDSSPPRWRSRAPSSRSATS